MRTGQAFGWRPLGLAGSVLAVMTLLASTAGAYCRTYTCQADENCVDDENGCPVGGQALFWPQRCFSFSVQQDASPKQGITLDAAEAVLDQAYATWTDLTCAGVAPSIEVVRYAPVACDKVEFNECDRNANAWIFRDAAWPYDDGGGTLAQTWVHFDTRSGKIYDADVEVNTAEFAITTATADQREQFIAIATHEIGHVFGLDHSPAFEATMYKFYSAQNQLSVLAQDDIDGFCAMYPGDRAVGACNPEPYQGFSTACGTAECEKSGCCATAPGSSDGSAPWAIAAAAVGLGLGRARLRRARA